MIAPTLDELLAKLQPRPGESEAYITPSDIAYIVEALYRMVEPPTGDTPDPMKGEKPLETVADHDADITDVLGKVYGLVVRIAALEAATEYYPRLPMLWTPTPSRRSQGQARQEPRKLRKQAAEGTLT